MQRGLHTASVLNSHPKLYSKNGTTPIEWDAALTIQNNIVVKSHKSPATLADQELLERTPDQGLSCKGVGAGGSQNTVIEGNGQVMRVIQSLLFGVLQGLQNGHLRTIWTEAFVAVVYDMSNTPKSH